MAQPRISCRSRARACPSWNGWASVVPPRLGLSGRLRKFLLRNMVTAVGHSVPRRDGASKVTGEARYTDDLVVPGAWYGKTVRSTVARGTIRSIELKAGFDWSRVVVVTADDIPGDNVVHLIRDDQPVLARPRGEIRHKEEPILLAAAADRSTRPPCLEARPPVERRAGGGDPGRDGGWIRRQRGVPVLYPHSRGALARGDSRHWAHACPNVRIRARAVATNTLCGFPWTGAIAADIRPIDDVRSTAAYRRVVTQNVLAELLNQ